MRSERILVVDDEKRIVDNISFCLKREGFETVAAYSGEEALCLFRERPFDLVLLDVSMPDMNGYEVMEHVFGLDEDVLVIVITGYASVESAIRALKLGAWDYLKKPFEYADLIKTVKNALSQKKLIDEKKAVSARLEASEKQYEYMVNNSPDLIFTLDENGCFTFVNQQFENVLGFSRQDLLGKSMEDIIHKGDFSKAIHLKRFEKQNTVGQDMHFRFKKARTAKSNSYDPYEDFAFMELRATPISLPAVNERDAFKGVYAVARDVTDRVNLEDQLRQAQKMEAIGTLAGGIAHDFNNILMGIQGYASLVKSGFDKDSDEYKRLASIDEYVFSGAEMAKQLLGFAQKTCKETSLVNLNYLLKMSAKMFGRTKKDILIEQSLEKDLWGTTIDEGQIKQVLMNLFVNAWQAMPDGGKIVIRTENVKLDEYEAAEIGMEDAPYFVKVSVTDTGIGMPDEIINRIFDPFFTTKAREQGTGLGLATAYGIIKSHNGMFKVDSQKGQGSSFMFFLPAELKTVRNGKRKVVEDKIVNGKGSILLVDDEKGVIEVCSEMLESLGYTVHSVDNGMDAVKIIKANEPPIDVVILDMVMPKMSGMETFDRIRQCNQKMKVLLSSGYNKEPQIEAMMEKGCNGFILKPFDVATLSEKIDCIFKDFASA